MQAHLCPPPLEKPPNEPPELRALDDVPQFSLVGSQLQRLVIDSTMMMKSTKTRTCTMPSPLAALKGAASLRLSRSFLPSSLKALATRSLLILSPADQVTSLASCSVSYTHLTLPTSDLV